MILITIYGNAWYKYLNGSLNGTLGIGDILIWDYDRIGSFPGDYYITKKKISDKLYNINLILTTTYKLDCQVGVLNIEVS